MSVRRMAGFLAGVPLLAAPGAGPVANPKNQVVPHPVTPSAHTNHLAREKSPYLLQHQHNPVDWFPWGEAAFEKARRENKPLFLSIGYSTCHWCHVMERESFENEAIARLLNEHFVSVKVDREERPDVDRIYMTFVQGTTGQGGWPLTVFLTPELKPFYGGTYFPPETRHGRPGFPELLRQISEIWRTRQSEVALSAQDLHRRLAAQAAADPARAPALKPDLLKAAASRLKAEYDAAHGGFGQAPKFPQPSQPAFLLRYGVKSGDKEAVRMVLHTCEQMAAGGIYDHLGGGFARYSVDAEWRVPHFEKMLYDNAQLVQLYLDAYLVSGEARFAGIARDILGYVLRDMTHPEGGFYSAEDADSEGKEGKFYCWTMRELAGLLKPEELKVVTRYFGLSEHGNFVDHSDPDPLPDQNVLRIADSRLAPGEERWLASAKQKMCAARARRVRPHLDDKILASWNGLMLSSLARASAVLADGQYLAAARRNLAFLRTRLWDGQTRTLYHRWRDGERDSVQLLSAYAFLLAGVLDLYEASLEPPDLEFAVALAESLLARFYDAAQGGFWQSAAAAPDLILRLKEDYDGAEPSGTSVASLALLKLAAITDRPEFREAAEKSLRFAADRLDQVPQAVSRLLEALDFWLEEPRRVVVAGPVNPGRPSSLVSAAHGVYQPNKVVLGTSGVVEAFARTLPARNGLPTAYVCVRTACQPPTSDPDALKQLLR